MNGSVILLLSLLCVAQALPLSLNAESTQTHLTRGRRHANHGQPKKDIADKEVRTIISAIVDAILDGDRKKRSDIPDEENEKITEESPESGSGTESGESESDQGQDSRDSDGNENSSKKTNIDEDLKDPEAESESGSENSESGLGSGSGSHLDRRSSVAREDDDSEEFGSTGESGSATMPGSGAADESGSGESGDSYEEEETSDIRHEQSSIEQKPDFDTGRVVKRDEEGQEVQDKIEQQIIEEKTKKDFINQTSVNITKNETTDSSQESGDSESGNESGDESGSTESEIKKKDTIISQVFTDSLNKRDKILKEEEIDSESNLRINTSKESNETSDSGDESDNESGESSGESSGSQSGLSSDRPEELDEESVAKRSVLNGTLETDTDLEDGTESESGSDSGSGSGSPWDGTSGYGFGSGGDSDKRTDVTSTEEDNTAAKGTLDEATTEESGSGELTSGDEGSAQPDIEESGNIVSLDDESESKFKSGKETEKSFKNESDDENENESESGSGDDSKVKRTRIIEELVTDMAKAAVASVEVDESDSIVKKSNINFPDDISLIITRPTSAIERKSGVPKHQHTKLAHSTKKTTLNNEIDQALKNLVKSVLKEDPSVRLGIQQLTQKRLEDEEKLERDILDLVERAPDEPEEETKEKVITEVKDFEGFVQALSQTETLTLEKHDLITQKLEKDLLDHLSIHENDGVALSHQENELIEDSELEFVKAKIDEARESSEEYALKHAGSLEEIRKYAIASLKPIIESLPLKKQDIEGLANSISKSAWVKMVTHARRKSHVVKKVRRSLDELLNLP